MDANISYVEITETAERTRDDGLERKKITIVTAVRIVTNPDYFQEQKSELRELLSEAGFDFSISATGVVRFNPDKRDARLALDVAPRYIRWMSRAIQ